jgi:undecaprenyl phosphate-alpha-L-ara4N flippase subunit ArnE
MWRLFAYCSIQSLLLIGGQVLLKLSFMRMPAFSWTRAFWLSLLSNWQFAACGLLFGAASLLWMYIIKTFPLSLAYPMSSISYVMAIVASVVFLHEEVSTTHWLGVAFIVLGCILIAK